MENELAHMLAGLFVGFLLGAAIAWRATSVAVRLTIASCLPSLIRELATSGIEQKLTSALSQLGFAVELDLQASRAKTGQEGFPSSGSSSGNVEESPTSTVSAPIESTRLGLLERGMKLSAAAMSATDPQELASSPSAPGDPEPFPTQESTPGSKSKKPCRLCLKIRGLVGGGGS